MKPNMFRVSLVHVHICMSFCMLFYFFEKTFDTTLHAKKMAGFVWQPRIKARNAQNVEAGVLNNTRQNTLTCTKYIFKYSPLPACLYEYKENATSKIWPMSQNSRPNNNTPSKWQCAYIFIYIYIHLIPDIYFYKNPLELLALGLLTKTSEFPNFQPSHGFRVGSSPFCSQTLPGWNLWPQVQTDGTETCGDTPPNKEACSEKISWPSIHFQVPTFVSFWEKYWFSDLTFFFYGEAMVYFKTNCSNSLC